MAEYCKVLCWIHTVLCRYTVPLTNSSVSDISFKFVHVHFSNSLKIRLTSYFNLSIFALVLAQVEKISQNALNTLSLLKNTLNNSYFIFSTLLPVFGMSQFLSLK